MATKLKNDVWSIAAIIVALFSLLYCFSFLVEMALHSPAADLLTALRSLSKGDS